MAQDVKARERKVKIYAHTLGSGVGVSAKILM